MLKVSKQTDYGILLLTAIVSSRDEGSLSARELSEMTHLPLPMVGKILKVLSREEILESQRGAKGGYSLARPADEITLIDLVRAIEGPVAITECIETPGECRHEDNCPVQVNWLNINRLIREALKGITLLDMTRPNQLHQLSDGSQKEPVGLSS